jgi:hypothetical protein
LSASARGNEAEAAEVWTDLINEVERFSQRVTVYVPLSGIQLYVTDLKLGGVTVLPVSESLRNELAPKIHFDPDAINELGCVCARVEVIAENGRAFELAVQRVRRVLDLFRYTLIFASKNPADERRICVGLGEVHHSARVSVAFCECTGQTVVNHSRVGAMQDFAIGDEVIRLMSSIHVFELATLLDTEADVVTDFENSLIRALHWVANAQTQDESENGLLSLVTALEVFFSRRDRDPITAAIAEGVAFVLGKTKQERLWLAREVRRLYGRRSGVSHGGRSAIELKDLLQLNWLAASVLRELVARREEFLTPDALHAWIDDQKMSL